MSDGDGEGPHSSGLWPGRVRPSLVVRNVRLVSVTTGAIEPCDLVLTGGRIAGLAPAGGVYDAPVVEGEGRYAVPGYVDPHLHIESSFVTPDVFAEAVLPHGTTTCAADAHEVTNVLGRAGLEAFMDGGRDLPLDIRWMVPSSVPSLPGFETTGGSIEPEDVSALLSRDDVLGLGEVMDAYGIAAGEPRMLAILERARRAGVMLEGHAPDVTDEALGALLWEGVDSDHSKSGVALLIRKAGLGMFLELQAKTITRELVEQLSALPLPPPFALCTDDVSADVLVDHGHLDHVGRLAVAAGLSPLRTLRAMTWEPAQRLRLFDRGLVAPGRRADVLLLRDLASLLPDVVIVQGKVVAEHGALTALGRAWVAGAEGRDRTAPAGWSALRNTLHLPDGIADPARFEWPAPHGAGPDGTELRLRAIAQNREDNATHETVVTAHVERGVVRLPQGVALLTVIERYSGKGGQSFAPVVGQDLGRGAVASTYAHDAHNLTVLGTDAADMADAARTVIEMGGGIAVVQDGRVTGRLPLPLAGVVSDQDLATVTGAAREVRRALEAWGYRHRNPFMNVSTLGLLVSPDIRLSDRGLVDVRRRTFLPPLVEVG